MAPYNRSCRKVAMKKKMFLKLKKNTNKMEQRKRSANFTLREKNILIALVQKNLNIVENKKTNGIFNKKKLECWEDIAREYNANQTTGVRTGTQLKTTFEQMKKKAKQHKAEDKVEILKTGGGTFLPSLTLQDETILGLLKDNFFSIENKFDSNSGMKEYQRPSTSSNTSVDTNNYNGTENFVLCEEPLALVQNNTDNSNNEILDITNNDRESSEEPQRKKQKVQTCVKLKTTAERTSKKLKTGIDMNNKKYEILEKKLSILNTIEQSEIEILKGKKIDNEIKEIVKERELLELKIKTIEFNKLCS